jgi:hypothetical protein
MRGRFDDALRSYAGALCRALGGVPLQPGTEGPTVLSVPVVVAEGQVRLDNVPEVLLSGGRAQDEALLGALQALQMPEWPQGKPGTVRLLVTFDGNEKQPLDCRPE